MFDWNGRVALVTGGSAGIGRAAAMAFAQEGVHVVLCDLHEEQGADTVRLIGGLGKEAEFRSVDVSDADAVEGLVYDIVKQHGRLDFAFNNAGIEGELATTADCSEANWDRTLEVNLKGVWLCMKYELQQMVERSTGSIVNCSSVAGLVGFPRLPAYVASKHGIVGLTRTAALEYAKSGVRINAVCPGVIHTAMIDRIVQTDPELDLTAAEPVGRMGSPQEVADAVLWLCSDRASFVTGQAIAVDGGWVAQ
jgi:NAD(P)-dependent dehydrogenase (short-subunit alcohol dehydrogenase family)